MCLFSYPKAHAEEKLITEGFEEVVLITADHVCGIVFLLTTLVGKKLIKAYDEN